MWLIASNPRNQIKVQNTLYDSPKQIDAKDEDAARRIAALIAQDTGNVASVWYLDVSNGTLIHVASFTP